VAHGGRWLEPGGPPGTTHPPAEVEILSVHPLGIIEAPDLVEGCAPHK
jgi:hypothetical protein